MLGKSWDLDREKLSMNRSESNLLHWSRVGQRSDVDYLIEGVG